MDTIQGYTIEEIPFLKMLSLMLDIPWLQLKSKEVVELYNFCDTTAQQDLIVSLLRRFIHINSSKLEQMGLDISSHVVNNWKLTFDKTLFIAIADEKKDELDGSQAYLNSLKNKFDDNWTRDNFVKSIGIGYHNIQDRQTAILFDDFIGSGETIKRQYLWFKNKMADIGKPNVEIKIVSYAIMESVYYNLISDGIVIYSPLKIKKGISEYEGYNDVQKTESLKLMLDLEDKLEDTIKNIKLKNYSLGYGLSESIYAVEGYNISDNVFPVFWWPEEKKKSKRRTLFRRLN
ncbi:hypothetical protein KXQ82_09750 [Mucilaginibacter sp. HMF5004]|uniref:phosphoribosyltransferase-like protein n=1 Tax=Mucilaginibacter rivuli TaxID=2857527 RepID=UPI001C5CFECC|nr:hypothetical protein [Mucilaginibacter rivuli]MBW4890001.1 hypothetical protein [Mucilaginibacter rivuli]